MTPKPGYAAGNILNMLVHLDADLTGYDFSELSVWEGYLQKKGVDLQCVNFRNTNLNRSVFNNTFGTVFSLSLSPDGLLLAMATSGHRVFVWHTETLQLLQVLTGHSHGITCATFSPMGKVIASSSHDSTIWLWDNSLSKRTNILEGHGKSVNHISFNFDGKILASASDDHTIRLWDIQSEQCRATLRGHSSSVNTVAFSPDGRLLASGGGDADVRLWDIQSEQCCATLRGHSSSVNTVAFSPDGRLLASGGGDTDVRLWDIQSEQCNQILRGHMDTVNSLIFKPSGTWLFSGSSDCILKLWEITGKCEKSLEGHVKNITAAAISFPDYLLAVGCSSNSVQLWNVNTLKYIRSMRRYSYYYRIIAISFSLDGSLLAGLDSNGFIQIWNTSTGKSIVFYKTRFNPARHISFDINNQALIYNDLGEKMAIWNTESLQCLETIPVAITNAGALSVSRDGTLIAIAGYDGVIEIRHVKTGTIAVRLKENTKSILSLAFSPDCSKLASGSFDYEIRIWDTTQGRCLHVLKSFGSAWSVVFSPDNKFLISGHFGGVIRLWNVETGSLLTSFNIKYPYEGMNITGATGLTDAQRETLKQLGAVEDEL